MSLMIATKVIHTRTYRVFHSESPFPFWILSPCVDRHERPVIKSYPG